MKRIIYFLLPVFAFAQSNLPEPKWDKLSVGVIGGSGYNATFSNNNLLFGLNVLSFSVKSDFTTEDCDYYYDDCESTTSESTFSAIVFMPSIGKQFDLRSMKKVNTYYKGEVYFVLPIVSIDVDGEQTTNIENDIEDITDMLGLNIAYGVEYKFNEQLSFSTDLGFNYLWNDIDIGGTDVSAKIGHSYTLLSLNFYME